MYKLVLVAATILSMVVPVSFAQSRNVQIQDSGIIDNIRIEGNRRIEAATVRSYMVLDSGDPFDSELIDLSLKTLFATGLFRDVLIDRDNNDLVVTIVENPIINQVLFEGNRAIRTKQLEEETEAEPRAVFTQARVQRDVRQILELYRRSGRFAASVSPEYKPLDQNRVDLVFVISEGAKTGVRAINFIGNEHFTDRKLQTEIITNQSRWWRLFDRNDNYDPDRLEYDRELLRQFYSNNGFADFRVESAVAALTPDREDFYITFTLFEGPRYNFGKLEVETKFASLSADQLSKGMLMRPGSLFNGSLIEETINNMVFVAGAAGYANVDIRPVIATNLERNEVDVTFVVDEGKRVYIERVDIVGNTRTLDYVIRREILLNAGDPFNRTLLDASRNRLRALRFFSEVNISEQPGSSPDRTVVNIELEEQYTGSMAFSVGYSTVEEFLVNFEIKQANFGGRGQYLSAALRSSKYIKRASFRFTEPKFLSSNAALGGSVFVTNVDYSTRTGYSNFAYGFGAQSGFPLGKRRRLGLSYDLRYDDIVINDSNYDRYCGPEQTYRSVICEQKGSRFTSSMGYNFNLDRRNDPLVPTSGYNLFFEQSIAGLGGDTRYLRNQLRASIYKGILPGFVASANFQVGYITGLGGDEVLINNRFFKGGNSFRGFDIAGLGPREVVYTTSTENVYQTDEAGNFLLDDEGNKIPETDEDGNNILQAKKDSQGNDIVTSSSAFSLGGKLYAIGALELTIPIPYIPPESGLEAGVFLEFGTVTGLDTGAATRSFVSEDGFKRWQVEDSGKIRASLGFSIFWTTQIGPLRFDFSTILAKEDYDEIETFRFTTRTQF